MFCIKSYRNVFYSTFVMLNIAYFFIYWDILYLDLSNRQTMFIFAVRNILKKIYDSARIQTSPNISAESETRCLFVIN